MTGPTHKQFSISFAYIAVMVMHICGMLSVNIMNRTPNYYLALIIMLYTSKKGALFPDIDHDWEFVKEKTTINFILNKLIHLTRGKHRSWQTHSLDICFIFTALCIIVPNRLNAWGRLSEVNMELIYVLVLGFSAGWLSHMFSDMLNGVGVRPFCWGKWKVAFVPHKFLGFRFNTGEEWEAFCRLVIKAINKVLFVVAILYPIIGAGWVKDAWRYITVFIGG